MFSFPMAFIAAVFFHLTQAVNRRVQNLGLSTNYATDIDIRSCVRKLMALAILPLDKVQLAFYDLRTNSSENIKQALHQLFLYFENQWMKNIPLILWNADGYCHRTNNICEGNSSFELFRSSSQSLSRLPQPPEPPPSKITSKRVVLYQMPTRRRSKISTHVITN